MCKHMNFFIKAKKLAGLLQPVQIANPISGCCHLRQLNDRANISIVLNKYVLRCSVRDSQILKYMKNGNNVERL